MCGILSQIAWHFFFRFWTCFDPLLAILLVLGGRAYIGEPGQKELAKIWNLTEKSPKVKQIELTIKMCRISSKIQWQFFFRFWTRFDPLLAILLVLGGRAYIGEPGQKDLAKICNLTRNHLKWKKSNLPSKCAEFRRESRDNFFSISDPFWPTFGHFTSSVQ